MNHCKMALSYQQGLWSPSDGMNYFNSAKINDRWFFFFEGGHFVLPRDYYQPDDRTPLSIEQLNEISVDNIFRCYLKKNEWEINDALFTYQLEDLGDFNGQSHKDTLANGKWFTNKKEYFESKYLRK